MPAATWCQSQAVLLAEQCSKRAIANVAVVPLQLKRLSQSSPELVHTHSCTSCSGRFRRCMRYAPGTQQHILCADDGLSRCSVQEGADQCDVALLSCQRQQMPVMIHPAHCTSGAKPRAPAAFDTCEGNALPYSTPSLLQQLLQTR